MTDFKSLFAKTFGQPAPRVRQKPCMLCSQTMNVSPGQIVYYHRSCRRKGRRLFGARVKRA